MMTSYQIGIDLGGTKTEAILFDPTGREQHRKRIPTPKKKEATDNYAAILDTVLDLIEDTALLIPKGSPHSVGICIPGIINPQSGLVINANTTCLAGMPFMNDIEQRLGRRVGMENDANCFTLAESRAGAAAGYNMVLGIIMGTGCGGGICIDGVVHEGRQGIAGEWGHFSVDPAGRECFCGNRGCIETKISGTGVENTYFEKYGERLTMRQIAHGTRSGDKKCRDIFQRFLDDFGRCVGGLISILDPDAIVLGGGLSNMDELYTKGVEDIRRYTFHQDVQTPILKNRLGDSAGVYGAAWIGV